MPGKVDEKNLHIDFIKKYPEPDIPADDAWMQMKQMLPSVPVPQKFIKPHKFLLKHYIYASAGVAIAASVTYYATIKQKTKHHEKATILRYSSQNEPVQKKLNDTVTMFLDKNTTVTREDADDHSSIISLKGAVYFKSLNKYPHSINIKAGTVEVYPITGNVYISYDSADHTSTVAVQSGSALVKNGNKQFTLSNGESVDFNENTEQFTNKVKTDVNIFSYGTHVLEFYNTSLKEAAADIEKAYGVTIQFKNEKLYNCRITTRFDNKPLKEILNVMAYTLGFEYTFDEQNKTVVLKGNGCN